VKKESSGASRKGGPVRTHLQTAFENEPKTKLREEKRNAMRMAGNRPGKPGKRLERTLRQSARGLVPVGRSPPSVSRLELERFEIARQLHAKSFAHRKKNPSMHSLSIWAKEFSLHGESLLPRTTVCLERTISSASGHVGELMIWTSGVRSCKEVGPS